MRCSLGARVYETAAELGRKRAGAVIWEVARECTWAYLTKLVPDTSWQDT